MKRRSFIQSLLAVPVVGALAKVATSQPSPTLPRDIQTVYKGFTLMWSGWIGHQDHPRYYGHWLGVNKKTDRLVYASYPGKEGTFQRGCNFVITRVAPQIEITSETPEDVKEQARMECLNRLIRVIDDLRPGLTKWEQRGGEVSAWAWFTAGEPIRKGSLLTKSLNSPTVIPLRDERDELNKSRGTFAGVALHDAMRGDQIKVGLEGSFPVLFK